MLSLGVTQRGSGLVDVLERLAIHWYMAVGVRVCVWVYVVSMANCQRVITESL